MVGLTDNNRRRDGHGVCERSVCGMGMDGETTEDLAIIGTLMYKRQLAYMLCVYIGTLTWL